MRSPEWRWRTRWSAASGHNDRAASCRCIEIIDAERCTSCDICVNVCPTNVFDKTDGIPVIARQNDCQTCFLCELYCPQMRFTSRPSRTL
jgi:NAD-dependent dihydropyrimidine dehydrogenase PreA subunit